MNNNAQTADVLEIDVMKIAAALWRNALAIILVALICGGCMMGYTWLFVKPTYNASVLVYINKSTISLSNAELILGNNEDAVSTYSTILNSRTTLEEIARTAEVPYDAKTLGKMITTTTTGNSTNFLDIEVTGSTPKEVELIANTIASVLPTRVSDIVDGSTLRVVDYAVIPSSRSSDSLIKNAAIGFAAGLIAACGIIGVTSFIRSNHAPLITSVSDLSMFYPEYPVLGVIRDLSFSVRRYKYSDYGYRKYSSYYSKPNDESEEESAEEGEK